MRMMTISRPAVSRVGLFVMVMLLCLLDCAQVVVQPDVGTNVLICQVYNALFPGDVHIAHLRNILAGSQVSIETVTGVGYKLVAG